MAEKFDDSLFEDQEYDEALFEDAPVAPVDEALFETPALPEEVSQLESAIGGIKTGGTLGFRDEIAGLAGAAGHGVGSLTQGEVPAFQDLLETYREAKGGELEKAKIEQASNPKTYIAGELASGMAIPMGGVAKVGKEAGRLKQLIHASKAPAAAGALVGAGMSEADLTKGDVGGLAKDVAVGGTIGAVLPGALKAVGKSVGKLADTAGLRKSAEAKIFSSVKPPKDIIKKELLSGGKDNFKGVGRALLGSITDESGKKVPISRFIDSPDDMARNLEIALKQNREKIAPVFELAQERINQVLPKLQATREAKGILTSELEDNVHQMLTKRLNDMKKTLGGTQKYDLIEKKVEDFLNVNNKTLNGYDIKDLGQLKTALGTQLSPKQWAETVASGQAIPEEKEVIKDIYFLVKDQIENLAEKASMKGENLGKKIKEANSDYSNLLDAKSVAELDMIRASKGPSIGYKDFILPSLIGGATSGPAGLAVGAGMYAIEAKTGRKIGGLLQIASAKGLDKLANKVDKIKSPQSDALVKQIKELAVLPMVERSGKLQQLLEGNEDITGIELKARDAGKKDNKLVDQGQAIVQSDPEQIRTLIGQLGDSEGSEKYVRTLEGILKKQNPVSRRAALYGLHQRKDFRKLLETLNTEDK